MVTTKNDTCTLVISDVRPHDKGEYKLVAFNNIGQCESCASVLVNESIKAPRFTTSLQPLSIKESEDAQLVVSVTGEPEVAWYVDEKVITDDEHYVIVEAPDGDDRYSLLIENCKPSDTGVYRCIARNAVGEAECSAPVNVMQKVRTPKQTSIDDIKNEPAGE